MNWFSIFVVGKGTSVGSFGKDIDIDSVSISSIMYIFFSTIISSSGKIQKVEHNMTTNMSASEKRTSSMMGSDISLAQNHVSGVSLEGRFGAKGTKAEAF